jgi:hypothetical protein
MLTIVGCWDVQVIREQLEELYALYEENFQLGSFLVVVVSRQHPFVDVPGDWAR